MDVKFLQQLQLWILQDKEIKFYKSARWRTLRAKIIARDNNECQHCKLKGKVGPAEHVHHIKELKDYPEFALSEDNLVALCKQCHNSAHEKLPNQKKRFVNEERW